MIKGDIFELAEDKREALWIKVRDSTEQRIEDLKNSIEIEREMLNIANKKLKKWKTKTLKDSQQA